MLSGNYDTVFTFLTNLGLNAPFGARCFLTLAEQVPHLRNVENVLMHLLALSAFGRNDHYRSPEEEAQVLMRLMALGAF